MDGSEDGGDGAGTTAAARASAAAASAAAAAATSSAPVDIPRSGAATATAGAPAGDVDDGGAASDHNRHFSPADPLDAETLAALMQKANMATAAAATPPRFSVNDVLRDPQLHRAARIELEGGGASTDLAPADAAGAPGAAAGGAAPRGDAFAAAALCAEGAVGHGGEVDRQRAAVREADERVAEESKVNRGMAAALCERLDSSRKALEGLAKLVSSLADSEQAYSSSLEAAARVTLAGDCDGASMRPALAALAALPAGVGGAHAQLAALLRGLARGVGALLAEYRAACGDIRGGAATVRLTLISSASSAVAARQSVSISCTRCCV